MSEKLANFSAILREIDETMQTGIQDIELKWNVIPWNTENRIQALIFREREFQFSGKNFSI